MGPWTEASSRWPRPAGQLSSCQLDPGVTTDPRHTLSRSPEEAGSVTVSGNSTVEGLNSESLFEKHRHVTHKYPASPDEGSGTGQLHGGSLRGQGWTTWTTRPQSNPIPQGSG